MFGKNHRSVDHSTSHLSSLVSLWSNIRKHLLFSGSSCAETLLWQKRLIPTPFYLKSISFFVNLWHITLSLNHFIMYAAVGAKKLASQKRKLLLSMKTLLLLLTKSPNARKFCFSVCFLSFFCFFHFRLLAYSDHYRKFAGFDSLKSIKKH